MPNALTQDFINELTEIVKSDSEYIKVSKCYDEWEPYIVNFFDENEEFIRLNAEPVYFAQKEESFVYFEPDFVEYISHCPFVFNLSKIFRHGEIFWVLKLYAETQADGWYLICESNLENDKNKEFLTKETIKRLIIELFERRFGKFYIWEILGFGASPRMLKNN